MLVRSQSCSNKAKLYILLRCLLERSDVVVNTALAVLCTATT